MMRIWGDCMWMILNIIIVVGIIISTLEEDFEIL